MPSSKKKNLKDIYMANSMEELNKLADVKTSGSNPTLLSKTADRLYTEALSNDDSNDEERAYIFYLRYVSIITHIRKTNQYKKDKAYFDKILGSTKPVKAITQAEKLQNSLIKRYEDRKKLRADEELAKKVVAKKNEKEKQPKEALNKEVKPSSDDILLDGNTISSVDIYQKLKVNHSSILTPEGSMSNGVHSDADALIPGMTNTVPCLSAEQLYSLMKTLNSSDFLILDIRSQKDYAKNHILNESCINIPSELLEHGVSVSNIDRRLQEKTRLVWRERPRKRYIIIADQSTKVSSISPSSKLFQFKEAIDKNDSSCQLMNEPLFLDGGFEEWLWHYPSMATKPELPVISSTNSMDKLIDVSSLEFPELPVETKPSLMEPKAEPTINRVPASDKNDVYPSLIASLTTTKVPSTKPYQEDIPTADRVPNPSPVPVIPNRPLPTVPEHSTNPINSANDVPGNQHQSFPGSAAGRQDSYQDLRGPSNQTTSRQQVPIPRSEPSNTRMGYDKPFVNQIPGNGQLTTLTNANQIGDSSTQQMPGKLPASNQFSTQLPNQQQGPDKPFSQVPRVPSNIDTQIPGQIPTSTTHNNVPGHKIVNQDIIPGLTPTSTNQTILPGQRPNQPKQIPGNVPISSNQNTIPRQTPISVSQNSVPGNPPSIYRPEPTQSPANIHNMPENTSVLPGIGPKTGHPPNYGQTVNPSPQIPQNTTKPANQGGPKAVVSSSDVKPSSYKTTKGLPPGWEKCVDSSNRVFYKDHNTQTTHWNLPNTTPAQKPTTQDNFISQNTPKQQFPKQLESTPAQAGKPKSNLRRSLSSPNLANLDDGDENGIRADPVVNRSLKPTTKPTFNRSAKPLTTQKIDSLNPVRGGTGRGLTGLRNLGNTCYMNSVLQCLFSTAPLAQYFISGAFRDDLNTRNPMGTRGELAEQFSFLVRVALSGQFKSLSPTDFKKTVGKIKSTFSGFDQQDSQEFLALMMDKLHEDVNMVLKKPYLEAPSEDLEPREAAEISWSNHKTRNRSIMLELFDGLFMSTVQCLVCGKKSVTFETFSNLTLPIPANSNHCSLQDCINLFTRPEKMSGDDKWFCPQCKQHREASKQLQIWKLPPILVIHLKRFQYDGMWRQKLQTSITFPIVDLDMSGHIMGPKSQPPYSLYAISNHYGTMHGGHYTAFCRNPHNRRWYKFDDQIVSEISNSNAIVTSAGYLLFYTSIPFQPPKMF